MSRGLRAGLKYWAPAGMRMLSGTVTPPAPANAGTMANAHYRHV